MQENRTSTYNNVSNLKSFQDVRTLTKKINHRLIFTFFEVAIVLPPDD